MTGESRNFIAVASAEHVRRGRAAGFMQVCHGKAAPLKRVTPRSRVVYYSPSEQFGARDRLQAFTALGVVKDAAPYPFDMGGGFAPWRRDVEWLAAREVPIKPLLDRLEFCIGLRSWGQKFRFGLFTIGARDMATIAAAMGVTLS
jgi:hypothetical protein